MSLRHQFQINPEKPFENDKLQREEEAITLTNLVKNYADGFVLAINNEWGAGKTTFLKMWQAHLKLEGAESLYFNAWENDHQTDVLVALLSELKELEDKDKAEFKEVVQKAGPIAGKVALGALKGLVASYGLDKVLQGAIEGAVEGSDDLLKAEIDAYSKKKAALEDFKGALSKFAEAAGGENPLVFIIDELDRCRPSYAVEVLEQIKHVFSVPGIVFVLSIDKVQLGHAIKGVYGSSEMNDVKYLMRFIDVEYCMPQPSRQAYCEYLYDYFALNEVLADTHQKTGNKNFGRNIRGFLSHFGEYFNLNARQLEKLAAQLKISFSAFEVGVSIAPTVYLLMAALKLYRTQVYNSIINLEFSVQELIDTMEEVIPARISNHDHGVTVFTFIFLYHSEVKYYNPEIANLLVNNDIGLPQLFYDFKHFKTNEEQDVRHLYELSRNPATLRLRLSDLVPTIELSRAYFTE